MTRIPRVPPARILLSRRARRWSAALGLGLLLGVTLHMAFGAPGTPWAGARIVYGDAEIREIESHLRDRLGRAPTGGEIRSAVETGIRDSLLLRAAVARGYEAHGADPRTALPRRMERIVRAGWDGPSPSPDEIAAYHDLRRERFTGPLTDEVRAQIAGEIEEESRSAVLEQFVREVAAGVRVVLTGAARDLPAATPLPAAVTGAEADERTGLLLLRELTSGSYDARFSAPPGGESGGLRPVLPESCTLSEPFAVAPAGRAGPVARGRMDCPGDLFGLRIGAEGLAGPAEALHVEVETLEGRRGAWLLTSTESSLVLPPSPARHRIALDAVRDAAATQPLDHPELVLLFLGLGIVAGGLATAGPGVAGFAGGHIGAHALSGVEGPLLPSPLVAGFALALLLLLGLAASERREGFARSRLAPLGVTGLLLGALYGAVTVAPGPSPWFTSGEAMAWRAWASLGFAALLLVPAGVGAAAGRRAPARATAGLALAGLAVALLVVWFPGLRDLSLVGLPRGPLAAGLLALASGLVLPRVGLRLGTASLVAFALLLGAGAGFPTVEGAHDPASLLLLGGLFLVGLALVVGPSIPAHWALTGAALGALGGGWVLGASLPPDGTLPWAAAVGTGILLLWIHALGTRLGEALPPERRAGVARVGGAVAIAAAVLWRLDGYRAWATDELSASLAFGFLPLPVPALLLLSLALVLWPRRRKVAEALGAGPRPGSSHRVALGLAFFLLPVGTVLLPNPIHRASAPDEDDARRIVTELLRNTYHAFNVEDEDELYDRLSQSVTTTLLPSLYLDSRRRLTAGTTDEDEVLVRGVELVPTGASVSGVDAGTGFTYSGSWVVTARIRHLQHMHDRRNVYTGTLAIRRDEGRWKLERVDLVGEERVVAPWDPSG